MARTLRSLLILLLGIAGLVWAAPAEAQVQRTSVRAGDVLAWPDRHLGDEVDLVGELEGIRFIPGGLELTLSNRRRRHVDAPPEALFRVRLAEPVDPNPFIVGRLFRVSGIVGPVVSGDPIPLVLDAKLVEALDPAAGPGSPAVPPPAYLPPIEARPGVVPYPYPVYVPVPVPGWPGHPWWRSPRWGPDPVSPAAAPSPASPPSAAPNPPRPPQAGSAQPAPAITPTAPPREGRNKPRWTKPEAAVPAAAPQGRSPSPSFADK